MMLRIVLDTNILVSALWSPLGNASAIINLVLTDKIMPCFNQDIINEYRIVLARPKLAFSNGLANTLIKEITDRGILVTVIPGNIPMSDESDRKFYDTAKHCDAFLITGNIKHYPKDKQIISPANFLELYLKNSGS